MLTTHSPETSGERPGENKDAAADVGVRVRGCVVVHVEQPVIQVLVVVTTTVQARVGSVIVPVIRDGTNK